MDKIITEYSSHWTFVTSKHFYINITIIEDGSINAWMKLITDEHPGIISTPKIKRLTFKLILFVTL